VTERSVPIWPALAFGLAFPSLVTLAYFVVLAGQPVPAPQAAYVAGKAVQFAFPLLWVMAVTRRRPRPAWPVGGDLLAGAGFGVFVFVLMLALYHGVFKPLDVFAGAPTEAIRAKVRSFGVTGGGSFLALGLFYSVCHSLLEEYYWRWFVYGQLRRVGAVGVALVVSSVGFTAHHVIVLAVYFGWCSVWTYVFSAAVAVGGAVWAWLYERSGSLVAPWVSHLLVDAAIFTVGYDLVRDLLSP
jgi:membrane protease YdiL (CAAX protease family)